MSIAKRYREYARVIDMCEGTGVEPNSCIKYMGGIWPIGNKLDLDRQGPYDFAVAIVGGKPMFVGDVVISDGMQLTFTSKTKIDVNPDPRTWNKPKRTFTLAGHELPMPSKTITQCHAYAGRRPYYFDDPADRYAFEDALNAIIHEAMQK